MHELGLYVFSNNNEEKMTVKQNTNWTVFGEIQTATKTFIACLTRFRLILYPKKSKNSIESPQTHGDSSYPSPAHTHGNRHGNPHTHGRCASWCMWLRGQRMSSRIWTFVFGAELGVQSQQRRTTVHNTHSCSQHCLVLEQTSESSAGAWRERATVLMIGGLLIVGSRSWGHTQQSWA